MKQKTEWVTRDDPRSDRLRRWIIPSTGGNVYCCREDDYRWVNFGCRNIVDWCTGTGVGSKILGDSDETEN